MHDREASARSRIRSGRRSRPQKAQKAQNRVDYMPGTTRLFGLILIVLGVASYVLTDRTSVTALIPAIFGAVLVICALDRAQRSRCASTRCMPRWRWV